MCYGENLNSKKKKKEKRIAAYNNFIWGKIQVKECPGALRNCIISWTNATLLYIQSFKENFPVNLRQNSKRKHILPEHEFDRYWMWCNKKMMYRKRCLYIKKGWSFEWIVQKEKLLVWVVRVMNYTSTKLNSGHCICLYSNPVNTL